MATVKYTNVINQYAEQAVKDKLTKGMVSTQAWRGAAENLGVTSNKFANDVMKQIPLVKSKVVAERIQALKAEIAKLEALQIG
jgi:hypothetical protein